jgi:hypothetical protein
MCHRVCELKLKVTLLKALVMVGQNISEVCCMSMFGESLVLGLSS